MNRTLMYLFFLFITSSAFALECSQNGTNVYFINGVLTNSIDSTKWVPAYKTGFCAFIKEF